MPWRGADYDGEFPSLGWALVPWFETYLRVPSGPLYDRPYKLTDEQISFLVRLYRLHPDGRRFYRRAALRRAKGWGKSPFAAAIAIGEFAGPVVFDGWDAAGEPVGRPWPNPWVQILALSEDQTDNTYLALREMLAQSPAIDELGFDVGKLKVEFTDRPGKIEPVTSSASAREGQPVTAAVLDETHLWTPEKHGHKLAATVRRNTAKTGGLSFETTNAHELGLDTVAERTLDAANDPKQKGLLYDAVEAPVVEDFADVESMREALAVAYGDSTWVDLDRLIEDANDVNMMPEDVYRFFFNIPQKSSNRAIDPRKWAEVAEPDRYPDIREYDGPVLVAFDGAFTHDCAAITGWTLEERPHHFKWHVWTRPVSAGQAYEHSRGEMRRQMRLANEELNVAAIVVDWSFQPMLSLYDEWFDEYGLDVDSGKCVKFPTATGARMEPAIQRFITDLDERLFSHDGDPEVTRHVENAVLASNRGGWLTITKEKDSLKIDSAVTAIMGYDVVPMARDMIPNRYVPFVVSV